MSNYWYETSISECPAKLINEVDAGEKRWGIYMEMQLAGRTTVRSNWSEKEWELIMKQWSNFSAAFKIVSFLKSELYADCLHWLWIIWASWNYRWINFIYCLKHLQRHSRKVSFFLYFLSCFACFLLSTVPAGNKLWHLPMVCCFPFHPLQLLFCDMLF